MRSDVKVFLICLAVVIIFVVAYLVIVHHSQSGSQQITAENVLPSQQPALTPTTPSPITNSVSSIPNANGSADIPDNNNVPAGIVPPATPTTTQAGLTANVPPTTMQGQIQPDGQVTMNIPGSTTTPANTDTSDNLTQGDNGSPSTSLNDNNTSDNTSNAGSLAGLNGTADSTNGSGGHHADTYVIRHGDTLATIARRVYGNVRMVHAIERANPGVDPRRLRVGQKIRLPHRHRLVQRSSRHHTGGGLTRRHGRLARGSKIYIVRRGDTLIEIARREYHRAADWKLIYRANRRQIGSRPSDIRIGEKLIIPAR
ncbi:MAG: LysM peptidoglycan-binding domain-containing protein [Phycisphaerae bacterium]|nr:LysM peptidoglycan-binding domain-containing protein [Phycisphaerae bacterium]